MTVATGTKLPPILSVWYEGVEIILLPFKSTSVLPVPNDLISKAPTSPLEALTPPPLEPTSLNWFTPCSVKVAKSSSPELTPLSSISSAVITVTGKASLIRAPLI